MNILVTRTDRLGDVLLATPVLKKLRELYPQAKITFLVQQQWKDILQYPDITIMEYIPGAPKHLVQNLKQRKFDCAIVIRDEKEVSWAVKRAGIPVRIGPYSTPRSFVLFNKGKWQRRSQCRMHEAEYNLQLLENIPGSTYKVTAALKAEQLPPSYLAYPKEAQANVEQWLAQNQLTPKKYVCIHPGSSGSARYLKPELLTALIKTLANDQKIPVVLTGFGNEKEFLARLAQGLPNVYFFTDQKLSELAELYRMSRGVIAHGTGPLHLAAAVNAPVYALFPPIFVLSEKRWGPLTQNRFTWVPAVECPAVYRCEGEKCPYFDCMDRFAIDEAVQKILQWKQAT